ASGDSPWRGRRADSAIGTIRNVDRGTDQEVYRVSTNGVACGVDACLLAAAGLVRPAGVMGAEAASAAERTALGAVCQERNVGAAGLRCAAAGSGAGLRLLADDRIFDLGPDESFCFTRDERNMELDGAVQRQISWDLCSCRRS